jgi:hypothetical protein
MAREDLSQRRPKFILRHNNPGKKLSQSPVIGGEKNALGLVKNG